MLITTTVTLRRLWFLWIVVLAAACGKSGGGGETPSLLGTVTALSSACSAGGSTLPGTTCLRLRIEGAGNASIEVDLRITPPDPAVPELGTVVLGTGGGGESFLSSPSGGDLLVESLSALGFRVVDRRWATGWFKTGVDPRRQSTRYAALLTWIHDNVHETGAFCASGNSGGASEISYALTTWGCGDILDVVVLTGGPPMARVDYLCDDPATPEWMGMCGALVPPGVMICGVPLCTPSPSNPLCPILPANATREELEDMSILHREAQLDFPDTIVNFVQGVSDCSSSVPLGILLFNSVTSQKTMQFADSGHVLHHSPAGRAAIVQTLMDGITGPTLIASPGIRYDLNMESDERGVVLLWGDVVEPESGAVVGKIAGTIGRE